MRSSINDNFELFHSFENVFYYPFLKNNIVTFQDGRHNAYLSFVLHYFVQFSRCDFWITWIQISILNTKYWNLISNFSSKGIFLLTRSQAPRVLRYSQAAATMLKGKLVGLNGLEPSTSRLSGGRSNLLSYKPKLVEIIGIEPMTPCLQSRCSPSWAIPPWFTFLNGGPKWARTTDLTIISRAL